MSKDLRNGLIFETIGYVFAVFSIKLFIEAPVGGIILLLIGAAPYLIGVSIIWLSQEQLKKKLMVTIGPVLFYILLMLFTFY